MKTREEIELLKANWLDDPCWDLWATEGFEGHEAELRAFQESEEAERARSRLAELSAKADELGCPGNLKLASCVETLIFRLDRLENSMMELRSRLR